MISSQNVQDEYAAENVTKLGIAAGGGGMIESMEAAEQEQRRIDRFWGLDFEVSNRNKEIEVMKQEEQRSILFEKLCKKWLEQSMWESETRDQEQAEQLARARSDMMERKKYLKTLYNSENASQVVIDYRWGSVTTSRTVKSKTTHPSASSEPTGMTAALLATPHHQGSRAKSSPSIHGGKSTGSLDKHFFPEEDYEISNNTVHAAAVEKEFPKTSFILSKLMEASDDFLNGSNNSVSNRAPGKGQHSVRNLVHGHDVMQWDQLKALEQVFTKLLICSDHSCRLVDNDGSEVLALRLTGGGQTLGSVLEQACMRLREDVRHILSYTVFGSWIKRNRFDLFSAFCSPDLLLFTLTDWLNMAHVAAVEMKVARRKIRTNKEHCAMVDMEEKLVENTTTRRNRTATSNNHDNMDGYGSNNNNNNQQHQFSSSSSSIEEGGGVRYGKWFAEKSRSHSDYRLREAFLARNLGVGDMVWAQHGNGCRWLPALVTCVHSLLSGGGKGLDEVAAGEDVVSYDLSYLLTQEAFRSAYDDSVSTAREIAKPMVARTAAVGSSLFEGSCFFEPKEPERNLANMLFEAMASIGSSSSSHHAYSSTTDIDTHMKIITDDLLGGQEESKDALSSLQHRCRSAVLGSAALSSAFLGTTLAAKQRTAAGTLSANSVVALDASDWRNAIVHALNKHQQQHPNETAMLAADDFAESVLAVLDITSFNML